MAEEAQLGRDAAILEVVMEASSLLTKGWLESLGAPSKQVVVPSQVAGPNQPSVAVVVQLPVVVATYLTHPTLLLVVQQLPTPSPASTSMPMATPTATLPALAILVAS